MLLGRRGLRWATARLIADALGLPPAKPWLLPVRDALSFAVFVASFFGCIYAGAVAVPVHPPVRNRVMGRVASIVADVQAGFVLTTAKLEAELKAAVDGLADGNSLQWCAVDAITPAADAKGVRIETILDPGAAPVSGDPERLQQVLWNLLANAVKFTNRGGKVQVRLERVN